MKRGNGGRYRGGKEGGKKEREVRLNGGLEKWRDKGGKWREGGRKGGREEVMRGCRMRDRRRKGMKGGMREVRRERRRKGGGGNEGEREVGRDGRE